MMMLYHRFTLILVRFKCILLTNRMHGYVKQSLRNSYKWKEHRPIYIKPRIELRMDQLQNLMATFLYVSYLVCVRVGACVYICTHTCSMTMETITILPCGMRLNFSNRMHKTLYHVTG